MSEDLANGIGKVVRAICEANESLRLENDALRRMLLKRGLKKQEIQKETRAYLKGRKDRASSTRTLTKVCREMIKILEQTSPAKLLQELPIPPNRKVN